MAKACAVCNSACSKYKCPNCYINYCSVTCCKEHQAAKCSPQQKTKTVDVNKKGIEMFTTSDTVSADNLKHLSENKNLKDMLLNPHLCNLLKDVNEAPDAAAAMARAMQIPIFMEFANVCLDIVENKDNHG